MMRRHQVCMGALLLGLMLVISAIGAEQFTGKVVGITDGDTLTRSLSEQAWHGGTSSMPPETRHGIHTGGKAHHDEAPT